MLDATSGTESDRKASLAWQEVEGCRSFFFLSSRLVSSRLRAHDSTGGISGRAWRWRHVAIDMRLRYFTQSRWLLPRGSIIDRDDLTLVTDERRRTNGRNGTRDRDQDEDQEGGGRVDWSARRTAAHSVLPYRSAKSKAVCP